MAGKVETKRLSISKLAMRFSLDRATVRKLLLEKGITPVEVKAKETIFELTEELEEALTAQTRPIDAAKLRKETADAQLRELKVQKELGEMCSVAEFRTVAQALFGAMHKKCAVQMPKTLSRKLAGKKAPEIAQILSEAYGAVFQELRSDYKSQLDPKLLEQQEKTEEDER